MSEKIVQTDDKTYCESIAKSVSDIIRFSLDDEFRKNTFELLGVSSTKETEKEIIKRLLLIIQNEGSTNLKTSVKKRVKNLPQEKDKENLQKQEEILIEKRTSLTSSTNSGYQSLSKSIFKKNWLQISSQQYRDIIKRRKSNYFSQPQFGQAYKKDFNNFTLSFSNSQPTFYTPVFTSVYNEETASSPELSDNGINYCHQMFKKSFEENARKYFTKNLKADRRISF